MGCADPVQHASARRRSETRDLTDTFKALSDETRLQMMALLLENEELCVCDFIGALSLTQSKASRHLRYLYNAGLVKDRREGVWIYYRLTPDLPASQRALVQALRSAMSQEEWADLRLRLAEWRKNRTC